MYKISFTNEPAGFTKWVLWAATIPTMLLSLWAISQTASDTDLQLLRRVIDVGLLAVFGVAIPLWVLRIRTRLVVDPAAATITADNRAATITAAIAPLPLTQILFSNVEEVGIEEVKPFADFGGWGIKGTSKRRLYGFSGNTAVVITHRAGAEQKKLYFLHSNPEEIRDSISAQLK